MDKKPNWLQRKAGEVVLRAVNLGVSLAGSQSLFGTLGATVNKLVGGYDFLPTDGEGGTINLLDGGNPHWIGLESKNMQYWAYRFCSPLAAVIDRLAEADTNGRLKIVDDKGNVKKNFSGSAAQNRVMKLLKKPNPMQTWEEFNAQQVVLCKIFGYCPVFALGPAGMDKTYTKSLWNLNPFFCTPIRNNEFDIYDEKANPIKEFHISIYGKRYTIPAEDVILVKDGYVDASTTDMGLPTSKVAGLDFFVSNICAAMEADNVLLKKKGPLGIFSHDPKPDTVAGNVPMTQTQKDEVQRDLSKYGMTINQLQHVVTKLPLKWNPMSFKVVELQTKETIRQGIDGICDRLGYPAELMSGKNATYENRNSAEKFLYQNNVIPFSLRRMSRYSEFFGISGLILDYDHMPVLQEDILHAGQASQAEAEALLIEWEAGMITWNQWQEIRGRDTVEGMDIYYPQWQKKFGVKDEKNKSKTTTKAAEA